MKPANVPQYTNRLSNQPPTILRSIPEAMNRRLSHISSDKQSFDPAIPPYQEALRKSGYVATSTFAITRNQQHQNAPEPETSYGSIHRTAPTLPPTLGTNSVEDCFPSIHPLHKIRNRNTLKLSYSCMPNIHNLIPAHNKSVIAKQSQTKIFEGFYRIQRNACYSITHAPTFPP